MRTSTMRPQQPPTSEMAPAEDHASDTTTSPFLEASRTAKQLAAAVLEVLAGTQAPSEAARSLGISLARYYQLELRALNGLVGACEARRRGRGSRTGNEMTDLRRECERLRRECARQQALVRATRRTGLAEAVTPPPPPPAEKPKQRRRRRPIARAMKMAALLKEENRNTSSTTPATPPAAPSEQGEVMEAPVGI